MSIQRYTPSPARPKVDKTVEYGSGIRNVVDGVEQPVIPAATTEEMEVCAETELRAMSPADVGAAIAELAAAGSGVVTAANVLADNSVAVADDGAKGIKGLAMAASTFLARLASGDIVAATVAEIKALLGLGTAAQATLGTGAGQVPVTGDYDPAGSAAAVRTIAVSKRRMIVTGFKNNLGNPQTIDDLLYDGEKNGKPSFAGENLGTSRWDGTKWLLYVEIVSYSSPENVATPDLVLDWTPNENAYAVPPTVTAFFEVPSLDTPQAAATPSIRALGTGATDAMPGNAAVLLATGATVGATSQAQEFKNGLMIAAETQTLNIKQSTTGPGTVSVSGTAVVGVGTPFTKMFVSGDTITVVTSSGSETKSVTSVTSDTVLITAAFAGTAPAGTSYLLAGKSVLTINGGAIEKIRLVGGTPAAPTILWDGGFGIYQASTNISFSAAAVQMFQFSSGSRLFLQDNAGYISIRGIRIFGESATELSLSTDSGATYRDLKLRNLTASGTLGVTGAGTFTGLATLNGGVNTAGMTLTEVLGAELIQDGGFADPTTYWTGATGWTFPTGLARHDAAGTGTLEPKAGSPLLAAATIGTVYKIQYTASVWTVAGMTVSFGGTIGQTSTFPNANGVYTCYVKATTVANLVLAPLTGGRFSIDNLSVKAVLSGGATGGGLIQHPSGESHLYADAAAKDAARTAMGAYGAGDAPAFAGLETSGFIGAPSTSCGMKIKPDDGNVSFFRANTCLTAINYYGFLAGNGTSFGWSSGGPANANPDTSMWRKSAGLVSVGTGTTPGAIDGSMQFLNLTLGGTLGVTGAATVTGLLTANGNIAGQEVTAPAAPAANKYIIFAEDNGAGKTRLMVQFATGAAQQIAIEP